MESAVDGNSKTNVKSKKFLDGKNGREAVKQCYTIGVSDDNTFIADNSNNQEHFNEVINPYSYDDYVTFVGIGETHSTNSVQGYEYYVQSNDETCETVTPDTGISQQMNDMSFKDNSDRNPVKRCHTISFSEDNICIVDHSNNQEHSNNTHEYDNYESAKSLLKRGRPKKYHEEEERRIAARQRHHKDRLRRKGKEANEKLRKKMIEECHERLKQEYIKVKDSNILLLKNCNLNCVRIHSNFFWNEPNDISLYKTQLKKLEKDFFAKYDIIKKQKGFNASKRSREKAKLIQKKEENECNIIEKQNNTYQRWINEINLKNKFIEKRIAESKNSNLSVDSSHFSKTAPLIYENSDLQSLNDDASNQPEIFQQCHTNQLQQQQEFLFTNGADDVIPTGNTRNMVCPCSYHTNGLSCNKNACLYNSDTIMPGQMQQHTTCPNSNTGSLSYQNGFQQFHEQPYVQKSVDNTPQTLQPVYQQSPACQTEPQKLLFPNVDVTENRDTSLIICNPNVSDSHIFNDSFNDIVNAPRQVTLNTSFNSMTADPATQSPSFYYDYDMSYLGSQNNQNDFQEHNPPHLPNIQNSNSAPSYDLEIDNQTGFPQNTHDQFCVLHDFYDEIITKFQD